MKKCFIFGALDVETLDYIPEDGDFVIAADRGFLNTEKFSVIPDIIIGDFDSLGFVPKGDNVTVLPVKKDDTDIGYAIKYAMDKGFKDFIVYGALGGLIDHTYANFQLASSVSQKGGNIIFAGKDVYVTAVTNSALNISGGSGRVSVFAATEKASGVTLKGLQYELNDAELSNSFPLGVSNSFKEKKAEISVKSGTIVVISENKL